MKKSIVLFGSALVGCVLTSSFSAVAADPSIISPSQITAGTPGFRTIEEAMEKAGLTKYLSPHNASVSAQASQNVEAIEAELGDFYAGTWIEFDEKYAARQVVAISSTTAESKTIRENPNIAVRYVKYSVKELMPVYEAILFQYIVDESSPLRITSGNVDFKENKVVVRHDGGDVDKIKSELERAGFDLDMLYFVEAKRPMAM